MPGEPIRKVAGKRGPRLIADVQPADIDAYYGQLLREGVGAGRIQIVHRVLRGAFGQAVSWRLHAHDGIVCVRAPRHRPSETRV